MECVLHVARSVRLPDFEEQCEAFARINTQYGDDGSVCGCDRSRAIARREARARFE
jgi:hypothetical protein